MFIFKFIKIVNLHDEISTFHIVNEEVTGIWGKTMETIKNLNVWPLSSNLSTPVLLTNNRVGYPT